MSDEDEVMYCDRCGMYQPVKDFKVPNHESLMCNLCSNCIIEVGNELLKKELTEFSELMKKEKKE